MTTICEMMIYGKVFKGICLTQTGEGQHLSFSRITSCVK